MGVLLNCQLIMCLLLRKVSYRRILKTRLRFTQKLFTQVRSAVRDMGNVLIVAIFEQSYYHNRKTL